MATRQVLQPVQENGEFTKIFTLIRITFIHANTETIALLEIESRIKYIDGDYLLHILISDKCSVDLWNSKHFIL